jgi:hypothetical protein
MIGGTVEIVVDGTPMEGKVVSAPLDHDEAWTLPVDSQSWRATEALRARWAEIFPTGRIETVALHKVRYGVGRLLDREHMETFPFPWGDGDTCLAWFMYKSNSPEFIVMMEPKPDLAIGPDGTSVNPEWVETCVSMAIETRREGSTLS